MNIRELDEESRRTGVWPPRRIILRVDREEQSDDGSAPVKVGEVDLNAPRDAAAPPKPRPVPPPLPAPSLSPSVTPSRRPGLPGSRGVTPAPAVSPEDAEFARWLDADIANASSEPEFQAPPVWLPDDVRVRAARRHRRVSRKARSQLFGASAATTLAVGGAAAVLLLAGLSQTESVGGSIGAPSIGLFGNPPPQPSSDEPTQAATPTPAAKQPVKKARRTPSRTRRAAPAPSSRGNSGATSAPQTSSPAPSTAQAPTQASNPPPPPVRRAPSNPPPPPPASNPPPPASNGPAVVWERPAQSSGAGPTAPSRPATTAPSRPAGSVSSTPAP